MTAKRKGFAAAGIVRSTPDFSTPDGAMSDVMNMRLKDGALRGVGNKEWAAVAGVEDVLFCHCNSNVKNFVVVDNGRLGFMRFAERADGSGIDFGVVEKEITLFKMCVFDGSRVDDDYTYWYNISVDDDDRPQIAANGNTLLISFPKRNIMYACVYDNSKDKYVCYPNNQQWQYGDGGHLRYLNGGFIPSHGITGVKSVFVAAKDATEQEYTIRVDDVYVADDRFTFDVWQKGVYVADAESFSSMSEEKREEFVIAGYAKGANKLAEIGFLSGVVNVRFAWRLTDGTEVLHTLPYTVKLSDVSVVVYKNSDYTLQMTAYIQPYALAFITDLTPERVQFLIANYSGIISSLCVYASAPIVPTTSSRIEQPVGSILERPTDHNLKYVFADSVPPADEQGYYLMKELSLHELKNVVTDSGFLFNNNPTYPQFPDMSGVCVVRCDSLEGFSSKRMMSIDSGFSWHAIQGKNLYSYNSMVFLGDTTTRVVETKSVFPYYDGLAVKENEGISSIHHTCRVYVCFVLECDDKDIVSPLMSLGEIGVNNSGAGGDKKLFIELGNTFVNGDWIPRCVVGYPDSRAKSVRFLFDCSSTDRASYLTYGFTSYPADVDDYNPHLYRMLEINLKSAPLLNFSFLDIKSDGNSGFGFSKDGLWLNIFSLFGKQNGFKDIAAADFRSYSSEPYLYDSHNRIQATEVGNVFAYPAKYSYRVGGGSVVAMSSNAVALSEGQFGQFPLLAFCSDGLWALNMGSGETLVSSIVPMSRITANGGDVLEVDGGSVFINDRGLYLASGSKVVCISEKVKGGVRSVMNDNVPLEGFVQEDFLGFIARKDVRLGYDFKEREILVFSGSAPYGYVYGLDSGEFTRRGVMNGFKAFVFDFPYCYSCTIGDDDDVVMSCMNYEVFSDSEECYFETRPITLDNLGYKRIKRWKLATELFGEDRLTVRLYYSVNGKDYFPAANGVTLTPDYNVAVSGTAGSVKSVVITGYGLLRELSSIEGFVVDYEDRYGDRLR